MVACGYSHDFSNRTQNRLTWLGQQPERCVPCGGTLTAGMLAAAAHTRTFTYDALAYGDSAHVHAVISASSGGTQTYAASYDAAGNMTYRTRSVPWKYLLVASQTGWGVICNAGRACLVLSGILLIDQFAMWQM